MNENSKRKTQAIYQQLWEFPQWHFKWFQIEAMKMNRSVLKFFMKIHLSLK